MLGKLREELAVLERGEGAVTIETIEPTRLLLGTAVRHNHPLILGSHSVHTSREALAAGLEGIASIRQRLQTNGTF